MNDPAQPSINYKTHILIGVRANGAMTVICHWDHVPHQSEVEDKKAAGREQYLTYVLCTPTSIMPVNTGAMSGGRGAYRRLGFL